MGVTPLMFAATYNNAEVVNFLLEKGANAPAAYFEDMNALHFAARYNPNPETVEALVLAEMQLETTTSKGATAAFLAASQNWNVEVVERLAKLAADTTFYEPSGTDVVRIVEARFDGGRDAVVSIPPEYQAQVLEALR